MTTKKQKQQKFEDLLSELEKIVQDLEGGQIGLDEALEKYEKGIAALKECYDILRKAEKRIEILTKNPDGSFDAKPFEGEGKEASDEKRPRARKNNPSRSQNVLSGEDDPAKDEKSLF